MLGIFALSQKYFFDKIALTDFDVFPAVTVIEKSQIFTQNQDLLLGFVALFLILNAVF